MAHTPLRGGLRLVDFVTQCCVSAIAVLIFAQVVTRYVFRYPLSWLEEVCGFLFVWLCFLGAAVSLQTDSEARVDILTSRLGRRWQMILQVVTDAVSSIILVLLVVAGLRSTVLAHSRLTAALEIPWSFVYAAFPLGMVILLCQHIAMTINGIAALRLVSRARGDR